MEDYYIFWASLNWLTVKRLDLIESFFGNLKDAFNSITEGFLESIGEKESSIELFFEKKKNFDLFYQKKLLKKFGVKIIYYKDENYPKNLKLIPDFPVFLYIQGNLLPVDDFSISVVGSRNISAYGKRACESLVKELSKSFTIISGFAFGVDTVSHQVCVDNNGRTIGVLGNGFDIVYPYSNRKLRDKILSNDQGAFISEYPFGIGPEKYNFPRRNRIIAGLSLGTLIVEAKEKSGSLITANLALSYNREVFAVPGSIYSDVSIGTNNLIKNGEAKLVQNVNDIFDEFKINNKKIINNSFKNLSEKGNKILSVLGEYGKDITGLIMDTGLTQSEISTELILLELDGFVKNIGMGIWKKS